MIRKVWRWKRKLYNVQANNDLKKEQKKKQKNYKEIKENDENVIRRSIKIQK